MINSKNIFFYYCIVILLLISCVHDKELQQSNEKPKEENTSSRDKLINIIGENYQDVSFFMIGYSKEFYIKNEFLYSFKKHGEKDSIKLNSLVFNENEYVNLCILNGQLAIQSVDLKTKYCFITLIQENFQMDSSSIKIKLSPDWGYEMLGMSLSYCYLSNDSLIIEKSLSTHMDYRPELYIMHTDSTFNFVGTEINFLFDRLTCRLSQNFKYRYENIDRPNLCYGESVVVPELDGIRIISLNNKDLIIKNNSLITSLIYFENSLFKLDGSFEVNLGSGSN